MTRGQPLHRNIPAKYSYNSFGLEGEGISKTLRLERGNHVLATGFCKGNFETPKCLSNSVLEAPNFALTLPYC